MRDELKDRYIYPAIFEYEDEQEIAVLFPDLDIATSGVDERDALDSAREILGLVMFGLEEEGKFISSPSKLEDIKCNNNQKVVLIDVYMPPVRNKVIDLTVKKTVEIPRWLKIEADKRNLNLSEILKEALINLISSSD